MSITKKFKAIAAVKKGQTICINDLSIVDRGSLYAFFKRTWYSDDQERLVKFLEDLVQELKIELTKDGPRTLDLVNLVNTSLEGLNTLADNYSDSNKTQSAILAIYAAIKALIEVPGQAKTPIYIKYKKSTLIYANLKPSTYIKTPVYIKPNPNTIQQRMAFYSMFKMKIPSKV